MKKKYFNLSYFFLLLFLAEINSYATPRQPRLIIDGDVTGLPAKYLFLRNAFSKQIIDSAQCENGRFRFDLNIEHFEPILLSLYFINTDKRTILLPLRNDFLSTSDKEYKSTGFYLDTGITLIRGTFNEISKTSPVMNSVSLIGSRIQNEPLFLTQLLDFALIDPRQSPELRQKEIVELKEWISRYPKSHWFMNRVYANKRFYSNSEISSLYDLFDLSVQKSTQGKALFDFANTASLNLNLNELIGKDTSNNSHPLVYKNKPTMIVFWASWCGPCRKEIPYLKKLAQKYSRESMNIQFASVSIDKNEKEWVKAVQHEKMPWLQLLVSENQSTELMKNYHFDAIPFILLIDSSGKEYARFNEGYYDAPNKKLEAKLNSLLKPMQ